METCYLTPFTEEVDFGQQFDIERVNIGCISELLQDTAAVLSRAKILKQTWIEDSFCRLCNLPSVNVVRLNLDVDRKFNDCLHKINYLVFKPFVLKDSSGVENNHPRLPDENTWVNEVYNSLILFYVHHSREIGIG